MSRQRDLRYTLRKEYLSKRPTSAPPNPPLRPRSRIGQAIRKKLPTEYYDKVRDLVFDSLIENHRQHLQRVESEWLSRMNSGTKVSLTQQMETAIEQRQIQILIGKMEASFDRTARSQGSLRPAYEPAEARGVRAGMVTAYSDRLIIHELRCPARGHRLALLNAKAAIRTTSVIGRRTARGSATGRMRRMRKTITDGPAHNGDSV